ncbi:unnamed protein product [Pseudo-nitzschia multistriata]|uniref:HPt domain-containing protein n=1 Tax=Pseudo-nitzschia multistriata TaxID=183589 RepID=A0A448YUX6_9STRA|nr:unnamed protein product [Pseudo-nitzschia multistriata]
MSTQVIDWDEAMQQCGEDEEFLRELLGDLRDETNTQMAKMEEVIRNPTGSPFVELHRAAHVIKGAASNLMCSQLRDTALALESAATSAANAPDGATNPAVIDTVKAKFEELKNAVCLYNAHLTSLNV